MSKVVYVLDGNQWPNKLLFNLTTNQNGQATFSLDTSDFPKADLNLVVRFLYTFILNTSIPHSQFCSLFPRQAQLHKLFMVTNRRTSVQI